MDREIVINKIFIVLSQALLIKTKSNRLQTKNIQMKEIHINLANIVD